MKKMCRTLELPSVDRTMQLFRCTRTKSVFKSDWLLRSLAISYSDFQNPYTHRPALTRARVHPTLGAMVKTRYTMIREKAWWT
jgi:hypothetical protein